MKKPIILLHGALGSESSFDNLKLVLAENYELFSFNFSGHGQRDFSDDGFGIEVFAEELASFILKHELRQANIFGYSMGGYVALYLASTQPNLIGSIVTLGTKFDWNPHNAGLETSRMNPEVMKEKIPAYTSYLLKTHGETWEKLIYQTAGMMLDLGEEPLLNKAVLSTINIPVQILRGNKDHMVTKEESKNASDALPHGTYLSLNDTPHPIEKVDATFLASELTALL